MAIHSKSEVVTPWHCMCACCEKVELWYIVVKILRDIRPSISTQVRIMKLFHQVIYMSLGQGGLNPIFCFFFSFKLGPCHIGHRDSNKTLINRLSHSWEKRELTKVILKHLRFGDQQLGSTIGLKISEISIDIFKIYNAKNLGCNCFRSCFIEPAIRNLLPRI